MLRLAVAFLVVALVAALFGYRLIADVSVDAAKVVFVVFFVLAMVAFVADAFRARPVDPA